MHCFPHFEYVPSHDPEEVDPCLTEIWDGALQSIQRRSGTASVNYQEHQLHQVSSTWHIKDTWDAGIHHPIFWLEVWHDQICTDFPHDTTTRNCPIIFTLGPMLDLLKWSWKCLERSKQHLCDNFLAKADKHFIGSDSPSTWHGVLLQSPHPTAPCSPGLASRIAVNQKKRIWSLWAFSNSIIDNTLTC